MSVTKHGHVGTDGRSATNLRPIPEEGSPIIKRIIILLRKLIKCYKFSGFKRKISPILMDGIR